MSTKTKSDLIDYNRILHNFGGDKMMVDHMLRNFESQGLESYVKLIFEYILKMNYEKIWIEVDTFRGPLQVIGADEADATAKELEKAVLFHDDREIVSKYLEVLQQLRKIKRCIDRIYPDRVCNFEEQIDKYESGIKEKYYMIIDNHIDNERKPACCGPCNLF